MKLLDKKHRIYSFDLDDLTFKDVRSFKCFRDNESLKEVAMFYKEVEDEIFIRRDADLRFCISILELLSEESNIDIKLIPHYKSEQVQLLIRISNLRKEKGKSVEKESNVPKNPNNKFIEVDDSIIQVSKIISVKPFGDRALDIMTTGKNASVRKVYPSSMIRGFELSKLKKLILEIA